MKNFKRVLAMTTAAVMAVTAFAGCSSNSANSGNVGGSTNVPKAKRQSLSAEAALLQAMPLSTV